MEARVAAAVAEWFPGPGAWLGIWLLKGSLLLALLFPMAGLLRRSSSSARHLVWTVGLAMALALPLASTGVLPWRLELPVITGSAPSSYPTEAAGATRRTVSLSHGIAAVEVEAAASGPVVEPQADAGTSGAGVRSGEPDARASAAAGGWMRALAGWSVGDVLRLAVLVWAAGAVLLLLWLGRSAIQARRLVRNGTPLTDPAWTTPLIDAADRLDLPDLPRLLVNPDAAVPLTCGILRPSIVLPPASESWTDERRRAVLCHELGHIRRRDLVSHLLGRLTCALYWFQPLAWSAARRMRAESERACDDLVLLTGTRASAYADHLLEIASAGRGGGAPAVAMPMAQPREFEARLLSILESDQRREPVSRVQAAVLVALVVVLAQPLVALTPARTPAQRSDTPSVPRGDAPEQGSGASVVYRDSVWTISSSDGASVTIETAPTAGIPAVGDAPLKKIHASALPEPDPKPMASSHEDGSAAPEAPPAETPPEALDAPADTGRRERRRSFEREIERGAEAIAASVTDVTVSTIGEVFRSLTGQDGQADPRIRASLIEALSDPDARVRRTAAWALSTHADSIVVRALAQALLSDEDQRVRETSAWALAQLSAPATDPAAVEALAQALASDASEKVRETAAWALAEAPTAAARPALERAVQTDAAASVRAAAAWALGVTGARASIDALAAAMTFVDADVRETAAWALGTIEPDAAPERLTAGLRDAAPRVRQAAAWALGRIADPETAPALEAALADENADVRSAAIWALSGMPSGAATDALTAALRDGDADVRAAAAAALGGHGANSWPWPRPWPRPRPQP